MAREPEPPTLPGRSERGPAAGGPNWSGGLGQAGKPDEGYGPMLVMLARLAGIGWFVAASIAGGALGGYWLDGRFDTRPWLTVTGLALGVAVAFTGMIRLLQSIAGPRRNGSGKA